MDSFVLKMIALVTMTVDHLAVALSLTGMPYYLCRMAGRLAFPLYAFLLVEGACHTSDPARYWKRLLLFGCLAQVPYSCLFQNGKLNVLFLFAGCLLILIGISELKRSLTSVLGLAAGFALCFCSEYGFTGMLLVLGYYFFRNAPLCRFWWCIAFSALLSSAYSYITVLTAPLICLYNGKRGLAVNKYLFYGYYPAHLLVLLALRMFI